MADTTNQKSLREFCNLSGCEVWKAIQKIEETPAQVRREADPPRIRQTVFTFPDADFSDDVMVLRNEIMQHDTDYTVQDRRTIVLDVPCCAGDTIAVVFPDHRARTSLRIYCAEKCMAYKYTKFIDGNNLKVVHKTGFDQYHG